MAGRLRHFPRRKEEALAVEAAHEAKFDKRLAEEEAWLREGIKARRTRNEGRVRALLAMREERAARRAQIGSVRFQTEIGERSGQVVFEADRFSKSFDGRAVVRDFFVRVMRGDRIGLIGPNGSGKTTLLKMFCSASSSPMPARCGAERTCRWPTTISSASSSIPIAPSGKPSPMATTP